MRLPFKYDVFSHTVCSEVLEHLEDDLEALKEIARVMRPLGRLPEGHASSLLSRTESFTLPMMIVL